MDNYIGVIVEASLEDKNILDNIQVLKTEIELVTEDHRTPWVKQWTMHTIELSPRKMEVFAQKISESLDPKHPWYADFKNHIHHYVIFRNKVFRVDKHSQEQYNEVIQYGLSVGIPKYQLDFHPDVQEWKR